MTEETRDIAVEARTMAREAHHRIGNLDDAIISIRNDLVTLREAVAKVTTKVAVYSAFGSLVGGGAVGLAIAFLTGKI